MFRVEYYHADSGTTAADYRTTLVRARKCLDEFIDNGPDQVRKVSPNRVDFRNGDYARIVDLIPLSAIMLTREERGHSDEETGDSIFDKY